MTTKVCEISEDLSKDFCGSNIQKIKLGNLEFAYVEITDVLDRYIIEIHVFKKEAHDWQLVKISRICDLGMGYFKNASFQNLANDNSYELLVDTYDCNHAYKSTIIIFKFEKDNNDDCDQVYINAISQSSSEKETISKTNDLASENFPAHCVEKIVNPKKMCEILDQCKNSQQYSIKESKYCKYAHYAGSISAGSLSIDLHHNTIIPKDLKIKTESGYRHLAL